MDKMKAYGPIGLLMVLSMAVIPAGVIAGHVAGCKEAPPPRVGLSSAAVVEAGPEDLGVDAVTSASEQPPVSNVQCAGYTWRYAECHCNQTKCGTWATPTVPRPYFDVFRAQCAANGQPLPRGVGDDGRDVHFGPGDASCGPSGECYSLYCGTPANHWNLWYRKRSEPPVCQANFGHECGASASGLPCCPETGLECLLAAGGGYQCL